MMDKIKRIFAYGVVGPIVGIFRGIFDPAVIISGLTFGLAVLLTSALGFTGIFSGAIILTAVGFTLLHGLDLLKGIINYLVTPEYGLSFGGGLNKFIQQFKEKPVLAIASIGLMLCVMGVFNLLPSYFIVASTKYTALSAFQLGVCYSWAIGLLIKLVPFLFNWAEQDSSKPREVKSESKNFFISGINAGMAAADFIAGDNIYNTGYKDASVKEVAVAAVHSFTKDTYEQDCLGLVVKLRKL